MINIQYIDGSVHNYAVNIREFETKLAKCDNNWIRLETENPVIDGEKEIHLINLNNVADIYYKNR